jgi:hypothetical protein
MIEQFLQIGLEFFKEIWFQLNSQFDLENTEAFKFLQPYLIQLQENPLYMGISIAALFLVPYTLIKVRSISKEREHKLDELMEEMEEEEEYDEDDPRRLRRSEPESDDEDDAEKPLFGNDESVPLSDTKVLDDDEIVITEEDLEAELKDLQDEMERTINQLTQQIEEPSEVPSSIKDLSQIHIGGDATIDESYSPETEEEEYFLEEASLPGSDSPETISEPPSEESPDTLISELSDEEILASLEPELEGKDKETVQDSIPDTRDYEPEAFPESFTFEPESDIPPVELNNEPEVISENFTFEPDSFKAEITPEFDVERPSLSMDSREETPSSEKSDSLIDRLKFLQSRFENRYQPLEPMGSSPAPTEKKTYTSENLEEPRRYTREPASVPPDSKKYMDLLESFIFMKDQKKHK